MYGELSRGGLENLAGNCCEILNNSRKYRLLFSKKSIKKSGPKGPSKELIKLILEIKNEIPNMDICALRCKFKIFLVSK